MQYSRAMDYERPIEDLEHAAATGYMSDEAFTEACYSLVERSPNNGIIGMGLRCQGEVRIVSMFPI